MKLTISKLVAFALISANGIHGSELRGSIEESKARDVELSDVDAADASDEIDLDSSSSAGATRWYTNWDYCVQDCDESGGSCCGGTAQSWDTTFTSAAACCNQSALKWNYDNCVAESTRCTDNDTGFQPGDGIRDTGPCSYNEIFKGYNVRTRASMTRSARAGTLKQDYPEVWKDTKRERNQCKKAVGPNECKNKGLCGETEFEEVKMVKIDMDSSSSAGATRWYTNWDYCVQDCDASRNSCCGGTAQSWDTKFSSAAACCNQSALKWNYDNCVAESTRCTDNDTGFQPGDGIRDTGPCSYNEIFKGYNVRTRASMTRSARAGTLKQDYPEVWKDTKRERNQCKKAVGPNECKNKGLCGETEFEEVKMVKIDMDSSSSAGATRWYTNWDYCVQDCDASRNSCCGGTAQSWDTKFSSAAACCNQSALKWNYDNCVAESTRCTDNDTGFQPGDGIRDTGPCSYNEIFSDYNARTRASMTRSARAGTLKQDYPEVWKDTKRERNQCKKAVGPNECRNKGLCGEAEFEEVKVVKIE